MEKYILYRKQIELRKNKDFTMAIPVTINPRLANFIIETAKESDPANLIIITFLLKSSYSQNIEANPESSLTKKVILAGSLTQFNYTDIKNLTGEYIFIGGKSNADTSISLTIVETPPPKFVSDQHNNL